jgi:pyrroline-5-carboxylate reductase
MSSHKGAPIVLVGAGKMGAAMFAGWARGGLSQGADSVIIVEPQPSAEIAGASARLNPPLESIKDPAAIVLAVKPQVAPDVLPPIASIAGRETVVVSIMAGRTIAFLEQHFPGAAVVRAMPNTPGAIGRGITVAVPNRRVRSAQRDMAEKLLGAMGPVEWIGDEKLMDAVTAVSGSGPAYVFLLAETLAKAGAAAGLPEHLAARLARATVAGSGELLHRSQLDAAALRENVTSPGGTTAAALSVLMGEDGLESLMRQAVAAATARSRELAG